MSIINVPNFKEIETWEGYNIMQRKYNIIICNFV